ncbi:MAG: hypothetical protein AAF773_08335 [Cyanobacteria bacterium P01_D01_bin.115]
MSRLHISHHSETLLVLRQDFDGGDLVGGGWGILTLAVGWVLMLLTGSWGWLILGIVLGLVGFNIVTAIAPSSGYRCYRFDQATNCLNIQERSAAEQVQRDEIISLSHIHTAQIADRESRDWKGVVTSKRQVLTLVTNDRTLDLAFEARDTPQEELAILAKDINRFLDAS